MLDGGLFFCIDMFGVFNDKFVVMVENGCVIVIGWVFVVMDDLSGCEYRGKVVVVFLVYDNCWIKVIVKYGVICFIIFFF